MAEADQDAKKNKISSDRRVSSEHQASLGIFRLDGVPAGDLSDPAPVV